MLRATGLSRTFLCSSISDYFPVPLLIARALIARIYGKNLSPCSTTFTRLLDTHGGVLTLVERFFF